MNIAFEISPLMTASGSFGDKSGVYRYTYGLISSYAKMLQQKNKSVKIFLFSFNYDLLKQPLNPELYNLFKKKNVTFLNSFPKIDKDKTIDDEYISNYLLKYALKIINKIFPFKPFYRKIKDRFRFNTYLKLLDREFKLKNIKTIVHSETCFFPLNGYKHVITIYDLTTVFVPEFHRVETIDLQKRKLRFASDYCDGIVCISQSTKTDLLSYSDSFRNKKIMIGYPGIDAIFKTPIINKSADLGALCQINNKKIELKAKKYLLYYGTFEPRKNLFYILRAFLDLLETKKIPKDFKLLMIGGQGWGNVKKRTIEYLKENYPTEEKLPVIISNYASDNYLKKIIKNAYALVYPSFYEGFGLPVLESMYLGTPVICSRNSSLTEVGGDAVLYVNPRDFMNLRYKIAYLINNPSVAKEMVKKGLIQSKKFSWEESSHQLYDFLQDLF
ncbi:MAG: glycosyl transferase, group 1 [uncultured bacterium]|nr:MAG: glycosyl transferase, group 1 [uncultured bacterium]